MEKRLAKVNISAAGGTASRGSKTCKITIPTSWIDQLGITDENRIVELTLDSDRIIITKSVDFSEFERNSLERNHELWTLRYYDGQKLCTCILADFTAKTIYVENYTEDIIKTAFGNKMLPTWNDFYHFLEERCIPRERDGIRTYLETIGLNEYDPFEIVKRTLGKMAEDNQWIEVSRK